MQEVDMGPLDLSDEEKQFKILDISTGKMYDVRDIRQVANIQTSRSNTGKLTVQAKDAWKDWWAQKKKNS